MWSPEYVEIPVGPPLSTSTAPMLVLLNDGSSGYRKAPTSNEGPHALICEYVAGVAAQAIGLNIPPFAVVEDYIDDAPKVFVSKLVEGADPWDGTSATLARVANIEMFALVPVFDTWVLNWDRYVPGKEPNYGNVLLAKDSLVAIDHTHCLGRKVTGSLPKSWSIQLRQDEQLRGGFPAFLAGLNQRHVDEALKRLAGFRRSNVTVPNFPEAWEFGPERVADLLTFLEDRALWLARKFPSMLAAAAASSGTSLRGRATTGRNAL